MHEEVAGITRFLRISEPNRSLEIGGTWVAAKWQRTYVNTEVKQALLQYAFQGLSCNRVEFWVNSRNYRSQMNVLRIGASYEGRTRDRQVYADGSVHDGLVYSMTRSDWPGGAARLEALIQQKEPPTLFLPTKMRTARLELRLLTLQEAPQFLALARKNRHLLIESFPRSAGVESLDETHALLAGQNHKAATGEAFYYGVWRSHQLVGQFQIKNLDWKTRAAELGYFIDPEFQRRGFATELLELAVKELVHQRGFRRMSARILPENLPSLALARKVGFQEEGIMKASFLTGTGRIADIAVVAFTGTGAGEPPSSRHMASTC